MPCKHKSRHEEKHCGCKSRCKPCAPPCPPPCPPVCVPSTAYGEFLLLLPFDETLTVQPGESLVFPTPTVQPFNVQWVNDPQLGTGVLLDGGVCEALLELNTGEGGANISLRVNGVAPSALGTTYLYTTTQNSTGVIQQRHLLQLPNLHNNLISVVNDGPDPVVLLALPNTRVGDTATFLHLLVDQAKKEPS